jgi:type II secretory pathway pseudopilin PulG
MKIKLPSHARALRAFTMVEIAICLAIIGFALVAIIGILPIGMSVQKDNREETVINFDANYLLNAIRSGALGQDELTNFVISITNQFAIYNGSTVTFGTNYYNNFTNGPTEPWYVANNVKGATNFLSTGLNIMGLLSIPKYVSQPKIAAGAFVSNFVTADFRAITGSPLDQGNSSSSKEFAFAYRATIEINPFAVADPSLTNWNVTAGTITPADKAARFAYATYVTNLQPNLSEIRLRMRWPILPGGRIGPGNQIYRSVVAGAPRPTNTPVATLYYLRPQTYTNGASVYPPGGGVAFLP